VRPTWALTACLRSVLGRPWDRAAIAAVAAQFSWQANIDAMRGLIDAAIAAKP